jgi:hypothetical protein
MYSINEIKGTKTAIKVDSVDQFKRVAKLLGYEFKKSVEDIFDEYADEDVCISTFKNKYGYRSIYEQKGYDVIDADEFPVINSFAGIEDDPYSVEDHDKGDHIAKNESGAKEKHYDVCISHTDGFSTYFTTEAYIEFIKSTK